MLCFPVYKENHVSFTAKPYLMMAPENRRMVHVGDSVSIACKAYGVPKPIVSWTLNGAPLDQWQLITDNFQIRKGDLTVVNITKEQAGMYGCNASNVHGSTYRQILVVIGGHREYYLAKYTYVYTDLPIPALRLYIYTGSAALREYRFLIWCSQKYMYLHVDIICICTPAFAKREYI